MTIPASPRRAGPFLGADAPLACPFTFAVFSSSDIVVTLADSNGVETVLALGTGYTVTLNADQENSPGGTATTVAAVPVGSRVVVTGGVPFSQPTDLPGGGRFPAQAVERALDRLAILSQQILEQTARALRLPVSSNASAQLPPATPGAVIGWNDAGTALVNRLSAGALVVSTFVQGLLGLTSASAFRSAIGAGTGNGSLNAGDNIGAATATTPSAGDNSTRVATTAFVRGEINAIPAQRALATQAEAEAGTDNTVDMSPLRTRQAVDARAVIRGFPDYTRRTEYFTDFVGGPYATQLMVAPGFFSFGGGGYTASKDYVAGRPGIVHFRETGGAGTTTGVTSCVGAEDFRMDQAGDLEVIVRPFGFASGFIHLIGFFNGATTAGICFRANIGVSANWQLLVGNTVLAVNTTSPVAVNAANYHRLRLRRVDADNYEASIDGTVIATLNRTALGANWPADASQVRFFAYCFNSNTNVGIVLDSCYYSVLGGAR